MANITKKGERKYLVRVSKQSAGVRRFVNYTFRGTLAQAREFARHQETLLDGGYYDHSDLTFHRLFEIWLATLEQRLAPKTIASYAYQIRHHALPLLGPMTLTSIQSYDVQSLYNGIPQAATVRAVHAALHACFAYAVRKGYIAANPATATDRPRKSRPEITVLSPEEARSFIAACHSQPGGIILEFALETGMRPEEYLAVRWSDLSGRDVSVNQIVQHHVKRGEGYYFSQPKTAKSRRLVSISEDLRQRIARHRIEQQKHRLAIKTWFDHDLIFPNLIGRPITLSNLRRRVLAPVLAAAGIEKHITLYSLRHSCATLLLIAGTNPKVVADRLGHSSVVMTLDTYSHVLPHIQDAATETLNQIMRG